MNTIYTVGYAKWTAAMLQTTVAKLGAKLLDIRMTPWSQRPEWRKDALRDLFGATYRHEAALGNKNYKNGGPIELAAPQVAMGHVERELQTGPVVLLCGCADVAICHRKVAAEFLAESLGAAIVHLDMPSASLQAPKRQQAKRSTQYDLFDQAVEQTIEAQRTTKDSIIRRKDLSHSIIDGHKIEDALWRGLTQLDCDEHAKALQIDQALALIPCPLWCEQAAWDRIAESFRTWSTIFGNLQLFWQLRRKRDEQ